MNIDGEIDTLVSALSADEGRVRLCAARVLANTHDPRAIAGLIAVLDDQLAGEAAADSLEAIGQPAVEPLIEALQRYRPRPPSRAARVLGSLRSVEAIPVLISVLRGNELHMHDEAADALWWIASAKFGLKQRFGRNADKWQAWWDKHKDSVPEEDESPSAQ